MQKSLSDAEKATKLETAASLIIEALSEDPEREGLIDTPRRFRDMFLDDFQSNGSAKDALSEMIIKDEEASQQLIMACDIPIRGICEHHLLPWIGSVAIGYIPEKTMVGLSKITRMVEAAARGLSIQERVTDLLATTMEEVLEPMGVMVVVESKHLCTLMRGVRAERQKFTTSCAKGVFLTKAEPRAEFMALYTKGEMRL